MRRITLALPDDLADEFERLVRQHRISRSRYLALIVAHWIGRADAHDELAAIHERMNRYEARERKR